MALQKMALLFWWACPLLINGVSLESHSLIVPEHYALALELNVTFDEPVQGIEITWWRTDGVGNALLLAVPASNDDGSNNASTCMFSGIELMRLSPQTEYAIEVKVVVMNVNGEREMSSLSSVLNTTAVSGATGLMSYDGTFSLDTPGPLCVVEGDATFELLIFDHPANGTVLLGVDNLGYLVYYLAPQLTFPGAHVNGPNAQLPPQVDSSKSSTFPLPSPAAKIATAFSGALAERTGGLYMPMSVAIIYDVEESIVTNHVGEFSATGEVLNIVVAPCDIGQFSDDDGGGGEGAGGCLTHELSSDDMGGLLTWRSVVKKVPGLVVEGGGYLEEQSAAVLGRIDRGGGSGSNGSSFTFEDDNHFDPFNVLDPVIQRGNLSNATAWPLVCNDGTVSPSSQDWVHCNAASPGVGPGPAQEPGFVLGLRSLSSVLFVTRDYGNESSKVSVPLATAPWGTQKQEPGRGEAQDAGEGTIVDQTASPKNNAISPPPSLKWLLSGEAAVGGDFTWANGDNERFYNMHGAQQVSNEATHSGRRIAAAVAGRNLSWVRLFDNGNVRPQSEGGTYSRAMEYEVDHDAMTVRAVWAFSPEGEEDRGMFSMHGGLVSEVPPQRLAFSWEQSGVAAVKSIVSAAVGEGFIGNTENDSSEPEPNRIVSFSCDNGNLPDECWARVYEVDPSGAQVARVTVPATAVYFMPGAYRSQPWSTLVGERQVKT